MSAEVIQISDYRVVDRRTHQPLRSTSVVVPLFRSVEAATSACLSGVTTDEDRLPGRGRDAG